MSDPVNVNRGKRNWRLWQPNGIVAVDCSHADPSQWQWIHEPEYSPDGVITSEIPFGRKPGRSAATSKPPTA